MTYPIKQLKTILTICSLSPIVYAFVWLALFTQIPNSASQNTIYLLLTILAILWIIMYKKIVLGLDLIIFMHPEYNENPNQLQEYMILWISLIASSSVFILVLLLLYLFNEVPWFNNDYVIFLPLIISSLIFTYHWADIVLLYADELLINSKKAKELMIKKLAMWQLLPIIWLTITLLIFYSDIKL